MPKINRRSSKGEDVRGYGLRPHQYQDWLQRPPEGKVYIEAISDNYLGHRGGPALHYLEKITENRPLFLHGVGLNLGSMEPFDMEYLGELKRLVDRFNPLVVSDHISFSKSGGIHTHSLLPLPRVEELIPVLQSKIHWLQDYLGRSFTLENISKYISYQECDMSEMEFNRELVRGTGAKLLLDVNNLFVTCFNEKTDPFLELDKLEPNTVAQFHVAGHEDCGDYLFDVHQGPIKNEVWQLLTQAQEISGGAPVILERDDHEPLSVTTADWDSDPRVKEPSRTQVTPRYAFDPKGEALGL